MSIDKWRDDIYICHLPFPAPSPYRLASTLPPSNSFFGPSYWTVEMITYVGQCNVGCCHGGLNYALWLPLPLSFLCNKYYYLLLIIVSPPGNPPHWFLNIQSRRLQVHVLLLECTVHKNRFRATRSALGRWSCVDSELTSLHLYCWQCCLWRTV